MTTALADVDANLDPLGVSKQLRKRLEAPLAREAAELHEARRRAKGRFPCAENGFFTRKGVEQMSRAAVADARADWIRTHAGQATVLDATCGVGADSVALARAGLTVISMDRDPRSALCASANLRQLGLPDRTAIGDALRAPVGVGAVDVLILDPDRRAEGERTLDPERWSPPLSAALDLAGAYRGACIKLAPAADPEKLGAGLMLASGISKRAPLPWHLEWVDVDRELCEVTLWTGVLALGTDGTHSSLSLRTQEGPPSAHRMAGVARPFVSREAPIVSKIRWFAEPNPSITRSGLLPQLAQTVQMTPLAPQIAWLGGPERPDSPFLKAWRVLDFSTADPKRVRAMLARHDIGSVAVKKRGHPDRPEVLERRFRGPGARRGLVAVARLEQGHVVFLLEVESTDPTGPKA